MKTIDLTGKDLNTELELLSQDDSISMIKKVDNSLEVYYKTPEELRKEKEQKIITLLGAENKIEAMVDQLNIIQKAILTNDITELQNIRQGIDEILNK